MPTAKFSVAETEWEHGDDRKVSLGEIMNCLVFAPESDGSH